MRVAVVAGPDPGHAFPALALCLQFLAAGDAPTLLTGTEWLDTARSAGVDAVELIGLDPTELDDDTDAGAKIHGRAARMAVLNVPVLRDLAPDLVVSDVITACGGLAAELLGYPVGRAEPRAVVPAVEGAAADRQRAGAGGRGTRQAARCRASGDDRTGMAGRNPPTLGGQGRHRPTRNRPRSAAPTHRHIARARGAPAGLAARGRRRRAPALRTDRCGAGDPAWRWPGGRRRAVDGQVGRAGHDRGGAGGAAARGGAAGRRTSGGFTDRR